MKNTDKERLMPRTIRDNMASSTLEYENNKFKSLKAKVQFDIEITIDDKGVRHLFINGKETACSSGEIKCILEKVNVKD